MATTPDGDGKLLSAREPDSRDDIGNIGAARDQRRVFINRAVPDPAGALVAVITGENKFTAQMSFEVLKVLSLYCPVKHRCEVFP